MSKKVYTAEDIYEGMVLKCVHSEYYYWTVGKEYIVDENLTIRDARVIVYRDKYDIAAYLNDEYKKVKFQVVEKEEPLVHLNSIEFSVPKQDSTGSYVNYTWLLDILKRDGLSVNLSKHDKLIKVGSSEEYIVIELLHEDLVLLAKVMNAALKHLRSLNQTEVSLKLNGQHFKLANCLEIDYSNHIINGLIGNI